MDSRRTADPDIPYPDRRFERAELMRNRTKRIASWPASFGSHQQAGHMTAIAKEASPKKSLPSGRPHMVGVAQPGRARVGEEPFAEDQARFLKRQLSLPVSTMSQ